jgi:large subunit ribosomal protein L10
MTVDKAQKELVVAELTEQLRTAETLLVADYRGLTNIQIEELRTKLIAHGARFAVVKNTLTRRAAEAAGADALLTLLEGPTAIAFIESDGDPAAVAKALTDTARETKVLSLRGGLLEGQTISADDIEGLSKLPPIDVLRGQLLAAVIAPLTTVVALLQAPLQDLVGLIEARIAQLEAGVPSEVEEAPAEEAQGDDSVVAESPESSVDETPLEDSAPAESSDEEKETT